LKSLAEIEEASLYLEPTQPFEFIEQLLGNSQVARCSGIHPPARSMSDG
jgi:hypothetical protein